MMACSHVVKPKSMWTLRYYYHDEDYTPENQPLLAHGSRRRSHVESDSQNSDSDCDYLPKRSCQFK